ncbi:MAG: nucleotide sugar dehydrogenase, partial [Verrucomicrobiota bacterium]
MKQDIIKKIDDREAVVGVIGLGYVGLPLLLEFAGTRFPVIGFDVDAAKINNLREGRSYIRHIDSVAIENNIKDNPKADITTDFRRISECSAILICVPTPLTTHRDPDLSYVEATARQISPNLRKNQLIVLESTTYPGTTEEVLVPALEQNSALKAGEDFFVSFSPEREDPNNKDFSTSTIPKVVGGIDSDSLEVARTLYNCIICRTVPVSSCRAAEATKLMENIFRSVNIALVNELKVIFDQMNVDVWEVIEAAKTKPFGYMPFYPGPGLGGHCIPIDPFYLTWKARESGTSTRFIELAGEINTNMPDYVIGKTMTALNNNGLALKNSRVLIVGLAYKKNVDDERESPSYVLWKKLLSYGAKVSYYDPYCPIIKPSKEHSDLAGLKSVEWEEITAENFDIALIATAHDAVNHDELAEKLPAVVDTR